MQAITRPLIISLILLLSSGCIQTETEYFLNPDGSGKVVFTIVRPLLSGILQQTNEEKDYEEMAREEVADMLEDSPGITAWKDVSYKVTEQNKLRVTGTAYFRELSKVQLKGDSFGEKSSMKLQKTANGMTILFPYEEAEEATPDKTLTPAEVKEEAARKKAEFQQQRMMLNMMLTGLRAETTIHLPGTIAEATTFTKTAANSVRISYDGEKILAAIDKLTSDDAWWEKNVAAGTTEQPPMAKLNQELFGTAGPPEVKVKAPLKPLFDYDSEVAEARREYDRMRKGLGLAQAVQVVPMAAGGELKNVRVGGVRLVRESDQKAGIRPFNWNRGFTVAVIAELPGAVLKIREAKVTKAITDNDENLLPKREWDRRISFPKLSKDHSTAILEASVKVPSNQARGLKILAGTMTLVASAKTKEVDLGMLDLKSGVKTETLGAEIKSVKPTKWPKGSQELELKLKVKPEAIAEIKFFDEQKKTLKVSERGMSWGGKEVTKRLAMKGNFPKKARIVVVLHDELKEYKSLFELKNIDLTGAPLQK